MDSILLSTCIWKHRFLVDRYDSVYQGVTKSFYLKRPCPLFLICCVQDTRLYVEGLLPSQLNEGEKRPFGSTMTLTIPE